MSGAVFFSGTFPTKVACSVKSHLLQHVTSVEDLIWIMLCTRAKADLHLRLCREGGRNCGINARAAERHPAFTEKVWNCSFCKLSHFIHDIFIIIITGAIINRSSIWDAALCSEHSCLPSCWYFQEYACIIPPPLSGSHYSLISLVYLLWWSAPIDMTAE